MIFAIIMPSLPEMPVEMMYAVVQLKINVPHARIILLMHKINFN